MTDSPGDDSRVPSWAAGKPLKEAERQDARRRLRKDVGDLLVGSGLLAEILKRLFEVMGLSFCRDQEFDQLDPRAAAGELYRLARVAARVVLFKALLIERSDDLAAIIADRELLDHIGEIFAYVSDEEFAEAVSALILHWDLNRNVNGVDRPTRGRPRI